MATTKRARPQPTEAPVDTEETFTPERVEDGEGFAHLQLQEDELRGDDDEEDEEEDSEDTDEEGEDDEEDEVQVENEQ